MADGEIIARLFAVIESRRGGDPETCGCQNRLELDVWHRQAGEEGGAEQPQSGVVTVLGQEFDRSGGRSEGAGGGRDDVCQDGDKAGRDG